MPTPPPLVLLYFFDNSDLEELQHVGQNLSPSLFSASAAEWSDWTKKAEKNNTKCPTFSLQNMSYISRLSLAALVSTPSNNLVILPN